MTDSSTNIAPVKATDSFFMKDVLKGLSAYPKHLPSKYFYDDQGDKLFQQIMEMPTYYLTNCEFEVLSIYQNELRTHFATQPFDLIELGAGDGTKTKVLLENFIEHQSDFRYLPIDISGSVLKELKADLHKRWRYLDVLTIASEYFSGLQQAGYESDRKKILLFLGGNIGNMSMNAGHEFLTKVRKYLKKGDQILIGFDLKKNPQTILDAYNDPDGITSKFNLNLLRRINRELGGNFKLDQFKHWETYNPISGETKSYIISTKDQTVYIEALNRTFQFDEWEAIYTELSLKYSLNDIETLAQGTGFEVVEHYFDSNNYFANSLWEVAQ